MTNDVDAEKSRASRDYRGLGVSEGDVMTIVESGELAAKTIESSYPMTWSAPLKYLGT